MTEPLLTALVISGLSLLLLFVALACLYGLMLLLTAITAPPPAQPTPSATRLRAAAIAVAVARAAGERSDTSAPSGREPAGWWSIYHQRRLTQGRSRRHGG